MLRLLFQALNVHREEESSVLLLLGRGFFMGIFLAAFQVTAESLFDTLADRVAEGILVSGALGIFSTALFTYLQTKLRFSFLVVLNDLIIFFVTVLLFVLYTYVDIVPKQYVVFAMFALIGPIMAVLLLSFWGVFGRLFDLRQSKRIIGGIDTGQLSAAILTFFAIAGLERFIPSFSSFPTENYLVVGSVSMLFSFFFITRIVGKYNLDVVKGEFERGAMRSSVKDFFSNSYILLLAAFMVLSTAVYWLLESSYLTVLYNQYQTENELRAFLGLFNGSILIFSFLLQTFFNDRIIANYGLKISLWVLPVVSILFTALTLVVGLVFGYEQGTSAFFLFFLFVSLNKLFVSFLREALENPTFKLYFMPLDVGIRFDIQAKVEGIVSQIAKAVTAGVILLLGVLAVLNPLTGNIVLLALLIVMTITVSKLYSEYRNKIKEKLESQQASSNSFEPERSLLIRRLQRKIVHKAPQNALYSFKLLEKLNPSIVGKSVNMLVDHDSPVIKDFAVQKMNEMNGLSVSDRYIIGSDNQKANGRQLVSGIDLASLFNSGEIDRKRISRLAASDTVEDRQYAAELIGNSSSNESLTYLIDLLHDTNYRVRVAAMNASQKRYSKEVVNALISNLDDPHYSNLAQNSLTVIGIDALPILDSAFYQTGQQLHTMLKIVQIIGLIGGNTARSLLWNKIDFPDKVIVSQVLKALSDTGFSADEQQTTRIKFAIENDVNDISWNLAAADELPENEFKEELQKAIYEENVHDIEHIYMLMGMLYDPRSIKLVKENIDSNTSEGITYAIELLDVFISEDLKQKVIPILDDLPTSEKLKRLEIFFPREGLNQEMVLKQLINRDYNQTNRWTKAITIYQIGYLKIDRFTLDLIANLFNPDAMVREVAAWSIYQIDPSSYQTNILRLSDVNQIHLNHLIVNDTSGRLLKFNKVRFLKQMKIFAGVPGITLTEIIDNSSTISLEAGSNFALQTGIEESFYVVYKGSVDLYVNGIKDKELKEGYFIGEVLDESRYDSTTHLIAKDDVLLIEVSKDQFYELLSDDIQFANHISSYMEVN